MISPKSSKSVTKISSTKAIALSTICLGSVCLASVVGSLSFVPSAFAQYGLGLPSSAASGGATRSPDKPTVTLIVPRDGAKTLSARPTFFLSVNPPETAQSVSVSSPKISDRRDRINNRKKIVTINFILRDGNEMSSQPIFTAEGKVDQFGVYKFTLPENAPALIKGKAQRWQIRFNDQISNVYATIRFDADPTVAKAIASASNELEKARIYTKNAYWYDALDAYTNWLATNPKDAVARAERRSLLEAGLKNHLDFTKKSPTLNPTEELDPAKLSQFIIKLDEAKNATSLMLQSKKLL